jgi:hypothetical protein
MKKDILFNGASPLKSNQGTSAHKTKPHPRLSKGVGLGSNTLNFTKELKCKLEVALERFFWI